jgi:hypothetical protein
MSMSCFGKTAIPAALIFAGGGLIQISLAATYYVDASRPNNDGNGQTAAAAKKYIASGCSLLSDNDTLIILDGVYSNPDDNFRSLTGSDKTIRARNDGGVIITAENAFFINADYLTIEGLKISGTSQKEIDGSHIKIIRCAFQGGPANGNVINFAFGGSYNLLEDCWFFGLGGRYKVLIYRADHDIMRRCVIRQDAGWTAYESDPEAGISIYESSHLRLQNVAVIDCNSTYTANYVGAYYVTGHAGNPSSDDLALAGCMSINNHGEHLHNDTDDGGTGCVINDFVAYGAGEDGIGASNTSMDMTVTRATIGGMKDCAIGNWGDYTITLSNSVLWSCGSNVKGSVAGSYCNTSDPNDLSGTGITHINPLTNGLLYLPRIEDGSTLKTGGSGNSQRGAQIINRIGESGTTYGEPGYEAETGESLWPWPNEDRIKTDMAAVSTRGFCAKVDGLNGRPLTLTSYIWEYLGNPCPPEIYGSAKTRTVLPSLRDNLTLEARPNPLHQGAVCSFAIGEHHETLLRLTISSVSGKCIATLLDNVLPAGNRAAQWNTAGIPAGVYLAQVTAGKDRAVRQIVLTR